MPKVRACLLSELTDHVNLPTFCIISGFSASLAHYAQLIEPGPD